MEQLKHLDSIREPLLVEEESSEAADENNGNGNGSKSTPAVGIWVLAAAGGK